jgi:hypothetical protein
MTAVEAALRAAADGLLAVLFAARCAACSAPLETPTAGPVCASCWASVPLIPGPLCTTCGDSLGSRPTASVAVSCCPRCRRGRLALDRACAMGAYEGSLRAIVHAFKFDGLRSLATPLATLMRARGAEILAGADAVGAGASIRLRTSPSASGRRWSPPSGAVAQPRRRAVCPHRSATATSAGRSCSRPGLGASPDEPSSSLTTCARRARRSRRARER